MSILAPVSITAVCIALASTVHAGSNHCGDEGVWIEILGAGSGELNDGQASPSYLIWHDDVARALVDAGSGSQIGFEKSGASFESIEAIALTQLKPDHSGIYPPISAQPRAIHATCGSPFWDPLVMRQPYIDQRINAAPVRCGRCLSLFTANTIKPRASLGYRYAASAIPATGSKRWSQYQTEHIKMSAIPVYGDVPALAWRIEIDGQIVVIAGAFNNSKNVIATFAKDADALVVSHAIPENSRGTLRELYVFVSIGPSGGSSRGKNDDPRTSQQQNPRPRK